MSEPNWIQRALSKNRAKAEKYLNDPNQLDKLVSDTQKRARDAETRGGPISAVLGVIGLTTRMITAWARGEYRSIPWGVMVALVSALIYFLSPIDLIPDMLVGLGLFDDSVILAFVAAQFKSELDRFALWEAANKGISSGEPGGEPGGASASQRTARAGGESDSERVQTIAIVAAGAELANDVQPASPFDYEDFLVYQVEDAYLNVDEDSPSFEAIAAAMCAEALLHNEEPLSQESAADREIEASDVAVVAAGAAVARANQPESPVGHEDVLVYQVENVALDADEEPESNETMAAALSIDAMLGEGAMLGEDEPPSPDPLADPDPLAEKEIEAFDIAIAAPEEEPTLHAPIRPPDSTGLGEAF